MMSQQQTRLVVKELQASWSRNFDEAEVVVWARTVSNYDYGDCVKALESLRATYDYPPTHRQFIEAVHAVGKARVERDKARASITGGARPDSETARTNIAKLRTMLRSIGNCSAMTWGGRVGQELQNSQPALDAAYELVTLLKNRYSARLSYEQREAAIRHWENQP